MEAEEDEYAVVDDYKQCVQELLSLLRLVLDEWKKILKTKTNKQTKKQKKFFFWCVLMPNAKWQGNQTLLILFLLCRELSFIIEPSDVIITNVSNNENGLLFDGHTPHAQVVHPA